MNSGRLGVGWADGLTEYRSGLRTYRRSPFGEACNTHVRGLRASLLSFPTLTVLHDALWGWILAVFGIVAEAALAVLWIVAETTPTGLAIVTAA